MSGLNPITEKVENHWFMLCRSCRHAVITQHTNTNCLRPAAFEDSRKKTRLNTRGFAWEYLRSCLGYEPGRSIKRHGKSSSLHLKKFFACGCGFFVSDVISGQLLGHFGPLYLALGANR